MGYRKSFFQVNFLFLLVMALALIHCQVEEQTDEDQKVNPIPGLISISPTFTVTSLPTFTLTAKGNNFNLESQLVFNANPMQTFYVSATEIVCLINPGDTVINSRSNVLALDEEAKKESETVEIFVRNPPPGGGDSDPISFVIHSNHAFAKPVNTGATPYAIHPDIAVDERGYIYKLYGDIVSNKGGIFFQRSTNMGKIWTAPASLVMIDAIGNLSDLKVSSNGVLMAVFCSPVSSVYNVHFRISSDEGSNWTIAKNISNTSYNCYSPVVAFDHQGACAVAWREYQSKDQGSIYLTRSADEGSSWHDPVNASRLINSDLPAIAFNKEGHLWLVFQEYSKTCDIYINHSSDGGKSWGSALKLSRLNGLNTDSRLAVSEANDVYVVWKNDNPGQKTDIIFLHSSGGATWSAEQNLSQSADNWSSSPDIYVDGAGNINVVYVEDGKIYFIRSTDKGENWSAKNRLDSGGSAGLPRISARNGGYIDITFVASSLFYCGSIR